MAHFQWSQILTLFDSTFSRWDILSTNELWILLVSRGATPMEEINLQSLLTNLQTTSAWLAKLSLAKWSFSQCSTMCAWNQTKPNRPSQSDQKKVIFVLVFEDGNIPVLEVVDCPQSLFTAKWDWLGGGGYSDVYIHICNIFQTFFKTSEIYQQRVGAGGFPDGRSLDCSPHGPLCSHIFNMDRSKHHCFICF